MATDPMALATALDPSLYPQQLQAAQTQQLAQLLMQQGMTPMHGTQSIGGVAIRTSPMEGLAKLGSVLSGQSMQGQAYQQLGALMQRQMAALRGPQGFGVEDASSGTGTEPSPQALGAALQGQPHQPQPDATSPAGIMRLPGMGGLQAMGSYLSAPEKYMESYLKGYTPNETTIQARQGGMDPVMANQLMFIKNSTDPKILAMQQGGMGPMQIYQAVFGEAAKNAEVSRRPGEGYSNALTGEVGMVGKIPEGANVTGAPGPNGQVSLTPMPGNAAVLAGNSAATTGGTNTQTPTIRYDADGNPVSSTKAIDVASASFDPRKPVKFQTDGERAPALRASLAAIKDPAERAAVLAAFDKQFASVPGATSPEQKPGVADAARAGAKAVIERNQGILADANAAPMDIESLNKMLDLTGSAQFGPGASTAAKWGAIAAQIPGAGFIVDPASLEQKQANVTIMKKLMSNMAGRMSGSSGTGTDARLQNAIDSLPNDAAPDAAIRAVVPMLVAQRTSRLDEARLRSDLGNDTAAIQKFETQWRSSYNPLAYEATLATRGMKPQEVAAYVASHYTPTQAAEIAQSRRALRALGVQF